MAQTHDGTDAGSIAELESQLEQVKRAQAGSDKTVARLQQENAELAAQLEAAAERAGSQQDAKSAELAAREARLNNQQRAVELALQHGKDPAEVIALLGLNDDADIEDRIKLLTDRDERIRVEVADDFAKRHGRTVFMPKTAPTNLFEMSDGAIDNMSDRAFERAMDHARQAGGTPTLRQSILAGLRGGRK